MSKMFPKKFTLFKIVRTTIQFIAFIILNACILGICEEFTIPLPILYPSTVPTAAFLGGFDVIQYRISHAIFPFITLGIFIVIAATLGRTFCGWICPFGLLQDLISYIGYKKVTVSKRAHNFLKQVKYMVLFLTILMVGIVGVLTAQNRGKEFIDALGYFAYQPFTPFSPSETFFTVIPKIISYIASNPSQLRVILDPMLLINLIEVQEPILIFRIVFLGILLTLMFFIPRFWCRYLCPVGALMATFSSEHSLLTIKRNIVRCIECETCSKVCPMQIPVLKVLKEKGKLMDSECIKCMDCIFACPENALSIAVVE